MLCVHLHWCNTTGQGDLMLMQLNNEQEMTQDGTGSTQPLCTEMLTHHPIFTPGPQFVVSSTLKMLLAFVVDFLVSSASSSVQETGRGEKEQKGISRSAQGFQLPQNGFQLLQAANAFCCFP